MLRDHPNYRPANAVATLKASRSRHAKHYALRDVRMVTLVAAIFTLGIFDLLLTLLVDAMGLLDERNPVARAALGRGAATLLTFKICLTLVGCALLLLARATVSGEVVAIGIFMTYAGLAVWWSECVHEFDRVTRGGSRYVACDRTRPRAPCNPKGQEVPRARPSPQLRRHHHREFTVTPRMSVGGSVPCRPPWLGANGRCALTA